MKTKKFLQTFLTTVFVFGTLAVNAQTKVYVHYDEMQDEYNIADIDSISFTSIPPQNLTSMLENTQKPFDYGSHVSGGATVDTNPEGRWFAVAGGWEGNAVATENGNVDSHNLFGYALSIPAHGSGLGQSASITNGKLYQTVELGVGKYEFDVLVYRVPIETRASCYLVVASGTDLPDIEDLSSNALNYVQLPVISNVATQHFVRFEVTSQGQVSLGFVVNVESDQFLVNQVELYKLK